MKHKPCSTPALSPEEAAFLQSAVEEGTRIQPRFRPEPLLAKTGRGYMASAGVDEIAAVKRRRASRK
jgi:hypothetical protein